MSIANWLYTRTRITDPEQLKSERFKLKWQWLWRLLPTGKWQRAVW